MAKSGPPRGLLGRRSECETLDRLLRNARSGQSQVLVLRGEAGIGKSALLEHVVERASGWRIVRATGVQAEMELPFAGLHQLCAAMLDGLGELAPPQRDALREAFGLEEGGAPDHFLVALAVLSLLADAAEVRPLACVIDDAQWLDRASRRALGFVARRLLAERIAMVFVVREPSDADELTGLPELFVEGVGDDDARALLASGISGPLDTRVRDRVVAETRGNPLALLELPLGLTPAELAGGFGLPDRGPLSGRIERSFLRRFESLPPDSRQLLLIAAAEPTGDVPLLWRAAERLGIGADALTPAEAGGLMELGARARFRHPLVRSAIYRAAPPHERQAVHRALAEATDPEADPDRRAWHRAHAAAGLDEAVAGELERSAGRARGRGGVAAAAAFLERAAELTPDPSRRGARALAAAQAKLEAGAPEAADGLLATAELTPLDEVQRAQLQLLRAQIVFVFGRGSDGPAVLVDAARRLEALDPAVARETYLGALGAAMYAGRVDADSGVLEVAEAARAAPVAAQPPRSTDLVLDGLARRCTEGPNAGVPPLRLALEAVMSEALDGHAEIMRWLLLSPIVQSMTVFELWDDDAFHALAIRAVRLARDTGALALLPVALVYRSGVHLFGGELTAASALIQEADAIALATGNTDLMYARLPLSAWRGVEAEAVELINAGLENTTARSEGRVVAMAGYASAILNNGLGRYEAAMDGARRGTDDGDFGYSGASLPELVEAAARSGRPEVAAAALPRLEERTRAAGTDWALGVLARSQALMSEGEDADALYREAIERLERTRIRVELARARLLYGEWLRREHRRVDAREQLRSAHDMFSRFGAEAFAERAGRELTATGETVRKLTVETRDVLTPQEAQVARLAQAGHTNPEIGAELFISPRTVEYHLHKVFTKLGISSRKELRAALADPEQVAAPA
ncbi:MAG: LuxR family transcriptional regulator [Actinobacteria bacterium]|nr:MAG: LuxR family transcriptional regulator [Actinomycetota bacterium]